MLDVSRILSHGVITNIPKCIFVLLTLICTVGDSYADEEYKKPQVYDTSITDRLESLERSINMMQKQLYNSSAIQQVGAPVNNINMSDVAEQFKLIKNDIENLQTNYSDLKNLINSFDVRLGELEKTNNSQAENKELLNKIDTVLDNQPQAGTDAAAIKENKGSSMKTNSQENSDNIKNPDDLYQQAFSLIKEQSGKQKQDYKQARETLSKFILLYHKHNLVSNARYWIGQTYLSDGNYQKAAVEFLKGYQSHPTASKAPDNLLELAEMLQKVDKSADVCVTLAKVRKEFPNLSNALKRKADRLFGEASCMP